jgi:enamine deaminase RidA (YjgF/YER057c/UK114 family)
VQLARNRLSILAQHEFRAAGSNMEFFKNEPPSRSTVQVAALPKDALIEIEAVALQ